MGPELVWLSPCGTPNLDSEAKEMAMPPYDPLKPLTVTVSSRVGVRDI